MADFGDHGANLAFLRARGGHDAIAGTQPGSLTPEMAFRLRNAGQAYETAFPGQRANYGEMYRDPAQQEIYYNKYLAGTGGLAAPPGQSRHQSGTATDVPRGPFLDWLHSGGGEAHGLGFLQGSAFAKDPVHVQLSAPGALTPAGDKPVASAPPPALSADSLLGPGMLQAINGPGGWQGSGGAGDTLQSIGSWLQVPNNPAGGAALLKSVQEPATRRAQLLAQLLMKERFTPTTDILGNQKAFDHITGKFMDGTAPPAGPGQQAAPGQVTPAGSQGGLPPVAVKANIEQVMRDNAEKYKAGMEAEQNAIQNKALLAQTKDVLQNPHVTTGAGAHLIFDAKSAAHNYMPAWLGGAKLGEGAAETGVVNKNFGQILGNNAKMFPNMRLAGPEITFLQKANGGLDYPKETNLQILSSSEKLADAVIARANLMRKHGPALGPQFDAEDAALMQSHPLYKTDVVKGAGPPGLPKGVTSIKILH